MKSRPSFKSWPRRTAAFAAACLAALPVSAAAKSKAHHQAFRCPAGFIAYAMNQPERPYVCLKTGEKPLPKPDRRCEALSQREREKRRKKDKTNRADCETALAHRRLKKLDCYNLASIRDFKMAALARIIGDDAAAEKMTASLCPLTAAMACMNDEPQCRKKTPPQDLSPWKRPWAEYDVVAAAKFFKKRLPLNDDQARKLAENYRKDHPARFSVDDADGD
jgi:hypothetical protein